MSTNHNQVVMTSLQMSTNHCKGTFCLCHQQSDDKAQVNEMVYHVKKLHPFIRLPYLTSSSLSRVHTEH